MRRKPSSSADAARAAASPRMLPPCVVPDAGSPSRRPLPEACRVRHAPRRRATPAQCGGLPGRVPWAPGSGATEEKGRAAEDQQPAQVQVEERGCRMVSPSSPTALGPVTGASIPAEPPRGRTIPVEVRPEGVRPDRVRRLGVRRLGVRRVGAAADLGQPRGASDPASSPASSRASSSASMRACASRSVRSARMIARITNQNTERDADGGHDRPQALVPAADRSHGQQGTSPTRPLAPGTT